MDFVCFDFLQMNDLFSVLCLFNALLTATVVSSHWRLSFADIQEFPRNLAHGAIDGV